MVKSPSSCNYLSIDIPSVYNVSPIYNLDTFFGTHCDDPWIPCRYQIGHSSHPSKTLVAVSKYKDALDVLACYEGGQRDFGENYLHELAEKSPKVCCHLCKWFHDHWCGVYLIGQLPQDIRWHFIGTFQSKKGKDLASLCSSIPYISFLLIWLSNLDSHPKPLRRPNRHIRKGGQSTELSDRRMTYAQRSSASEHVRWRVEIRRTASHIFPSHQLRARRSCAAHHHRMWSSTSPRANDHRFSGSVAF